MLWIHPVVAIIALLTGLYALRLGINRILAQHFSQKTVFQWKRHVAVGRMAVVLWSLALIGGFTVVRLEWGTPFMTGAHATGAIFMSPLLLASAATGIYMDKKKARRKALPLVHGACNIALVVLALCQGSTGWQLVQGLLLNQ